MSRSCALPLSLIVGALAGVASARGASADPPPKEHASQSERARALLRRGIALYREASYAPSVAALEQAHAGAPSALEPAEEAECSFYLAADYLALGSTGPARAELRRVIRVMPDYEPPLFTSPKVAALLNEVRVEGERAPRLRPLPPRRLSDAAVELRFEAARTGGRAFGAVSYRMRGEATFRDAPLVRAGENLVAQLPVERSGTLEYYAEALAPAGGMQAGSSLRPLELPVQARAALAPPAQRRARRGLWALLGVGAALTATGLGVGLFYGLRPVPAAHTADVALTFQVH
jgi:hypothetical protein